MLNKTEGNQTVELSGNGLNVAMKKSASNSSEDDGRYILISLLRKNIKAFRSTPAMMCRSRLDPEERTEGQDPPPAPENHKYRVS